MPLESSVVVGQLRSWWAGVRDEGPIVFIVTHLELDTNPQIVHTLEEGSPYKRRMGDILAWSDPL